MIEPHSGVSRGFGFVSFANTEDYDKALANEMAIKIDEREMYVL